MARANGESLDGGWRALLEELGPKLLLFARQQTSDPGETEDLVQEAFVRYWKARNRDRTLRPSLLYTYVKRIAIDRARAARRRSARERRAVEWSGESASWFGVCPETEDLGGIVEETLRELPAAQREVLVLKIWGELTFDQIGRTLGISPNTAASRYRYALAQLRRRLTPAVL